MHIHILGIGGTFMGGLAILSRMAGHQVSGSDADIYPPMSELLRDQDVRVEKYENDTLSPTPDMVLIGNALSRGHPLVERVLDARIPYTSGPDWLSRELLFQRWVMAVAGTHGKTTVSSMLAWILEKAGLQPGFLIGGVPENFGVSARLSDSPFFVIEADEYDTAFFDKRSKFLHYRPLTLILHNLEFDHADIFSDLQQIKTQFHYLLRSVPSTGQLLINGDSLALADVVAMGCWSRRQFYSLGGSTPWQALPMTEDGSQFLVCNGEPGQAPVELQWDLCGEHNMLNAVAAMAAAAEAGVELGHAAEALESFAGVRRRLQLLGTPGGIHVYDDFAHHPTAIETTLQGLRARVGTERIVAVLEPRSNTMKRGVHGNLLRSSTAHADRVLWYSPADLDWNLQRQVDGPGVSVHSDGDELLQQLSQDLHSGDHVVFMSNGGFGGLHTRLLGLLESAHTH